MAAHRIGSIVVSLMTMLGACSFDKPGGHSDTAKSCLQDTDCGSSPDTYCIDEICTHNPDYSRGVISDRDWSPVGELGGTTDPQTIGATIDTFCGIPAYQNGPNPGHVEVGGEGTYGPLYQCTEYAFRFICQHYAQCDRKTSSFGNATQWFNNERSNPVLSKLARHASGGPIPPRPGDVLVFRATENAPYGHVAIVKEAHLDRTNPSIAVIEQNCYSCSHEYALTVQGSIYSVQNAHGWLRADGDAACGKTQAWRSVATSTSALLWSTWGLSIEHVIAVGQDGIVLRFNGTAWSPQNSGVSLTLFSVWGAAADDVFAVGDWGTIRHWDGSTWSGQVNPLGTSAYLYGVWGTSGSNVYAVGLDGAILRYDGVQWSAQSSGVSTTLYAVDGTDPTDVYAVGASGVILHNTGASWIRELSGTTKNLRDVKALAGGVAVAVGDGGLILRRTSGVWAPVQSGTTASLFSIDGSGPADLYAVGTSGVWTRARGDQFLATTISTTNDLFAISTFGRDAMAIGNLGAALVYRAAN